MRHFYVSREESLIKKNLKKMKIRSGIWFVRVLYKGTKKSNFQLLHFLYSWETIEIKFLRSLNDFMPVEAICRYKQCLSYEYYHRKFLSFEEFKKKIKSSLKAIQNVKFEIGLSIAAFADTVR